MRAGSVHCSPPQPILLIHKGLLNASSRPFFGVYEHLIYNLTVLTLLAPSTGVGPGWTGFRRSGLASIAQPLLCLEIASRDRTCVLHPNFRIQFPEH